MSEKRNEKMDILCKAAEDKLGSDIRIIDMDAQTGICDQFLIVTARNINHAQALANEMEQKLAEGGYSLRAMEGFREGGWVLLDCDEIIVHIFTADRRAYYALEELWQA